MIPVLWRNIILLVVLALIIIVIIYAALRIQENNRLDTSNTVTVTKNKYQLVWEDDFSEPTKTLTPEQIHPPKLKDYVTFFNLDPQLVLDQLENLCLEKRSLIFLLSSKKICKLDKHSKKSDTDDKHYHKSSKLDKYHRLFHLSAKKIVKFLESKKSKIKLHIVEDLELGTLLSFKTINYNIWNVLNLPGNIVGFATGNNLEQSFYLNNPENLFVENYSNSNILNIRVLNRFTEIVTPQLQDSYKYTTASIISKGAFTGGFFVFRIKISKDMQVGGFPFIRLQSFINSSLNMIGNEYGNWPDSGEIDILEPISYSVSKKGKPQLEWTGKLWFSTQNNPLNDNLDYSDFDFDHSDVKRLRESPDVKSISTDPVLLSRNSRKRIKGDKIEEDSEESNSGISNREENNIENKIINPNTVYTAVPKTKFKPLKLDKFYTIGMEWTADKMVWYKNAGMSVTGVPSGQIIGEITSDQWWSVNSKGKLNPKPAPFNSICAMNLGIATPGTRYPNNDNFDPIFSNDATLNVDTIQVYSNINVTVSNTSRSAIVT